MIYGAGNTAVDVVAGGDVGIVEVGAQDAVAGAAAQPMGADHLSRNGEAVGGAAATIHRGVCEA